MTGRAGTRPRTGHLNENTVRGEITRTSMAPVPTEVSRCRPRGQTDRDQRARVPLPSSVAIAALGIAALGELLLECADLVRLGPRRTPKFLVLELEALDLLHVPLLLEL